MDICDDDGGVSNSVEAATTTTNLNIKNKSHQGSTHNANNAAVKKKTLKFSSYHKISAPNFNNSKSDEYYGGKKLIDGDKDGRIQHKTKKAVGGRGNSALNLSTVYLLTKLSLCNPSFHYDRLQNPRRVLTKPSRGIHNQGHDNEKHDLILYVNDVIGNQEGRKYRIIDLLGQGTFGQVVKCQNEDDGTLVAIKVIKNQPAFFNQSMMEVTVLEMLNGKWDRHDRHHIIRMKDTFVFRQHLCIVVELLSLNLYDLIKQNQYRGFSLTLCRIFVGQILDAMSVLREARIIHCDLKPENILLKSLESPSIKVIDYGSACHEHQTLYTYIQSRFYRSPEVLLGLPYSSAIDMWSLGCIAAELFLGLPIFPGASNYDQVYRIVQTLGVPPRHMIEVGKDAHLYFCRDHSGDDHSAVATPVPSAASGNPYALKSRQQYSLQSGKHEAPSKRYFSSHSLHTTVMSAPIRPRPNINPNSTLPESERAARECFLHFLGGLLNMNPIKRWSPMQASQHPFVSGAEWTGEFIPASGVSDGIISASSVSTPPISSTATVNMNPTTTVNLNPNKDITREAKNKTTKKYRDRANTLGSLSLQSIPTAMKGLAAKNAAHPEPIIDKMKSKRDDLVDSVDDGGESAMLFNVNSSFSNASNPATRRINKKSNTSNQQNNYTQQTSSSSSSSEAATNKSSVRTKKNNSGASLTEKLAAYTNNRRVSQPLIQQSTTRSSGDSCSGGGTSLPNWYGLDKNSTSTKNNNNNINNMYAGGSKAKNNSNSTVDGGRRRRSSLLATNSTTAMLDDNDSCGYPLGGGERRASVPTNTRSNGSNVDEDSMAIDTGDISSHTNSNNSDASVEDANAMMMDVLEEVQE